MQDLKPMARPFATLFALGLVIAVIARIGLGIMTVTGALSFDYISASGVATLDVVCSILTGSAFVAFMFAAALTLIVSTAGCALHGYLFAQGCPGSGTPKTAFLWGWATALVAIVCLAIVVSGILSSVQVGSMSSKLPGVPILLVGVIVFAAFIGTLLGAASLMICACVKRARSRNTGLGKALVAAAGICGLVVMVLTVGTFSALNHVEVNGAVLGAWFVADIIANVAMMLVARKLILKA